MPILLLPQPTSAPPTPKLETLLETFSSMPSDWTAINSATVSGGNAVLPCNSSYSILETNDVFDYEDSYSQIEVVELPEIGNVSTEAQFFVYHNFGNYTLMEKIGSSILCRVRILGGDTDNYVTYSSTDHKHWKMEESAGNILFKTSADGFTWTTQFTVAHTFTSTNLLNMQVRLVCGYYATETDPGQFQVTSVGPIPRAIGPIAGSFGGLTADFTAVGELILTNDAEGGTLGATVSASDTGSGDPWDTVVVGTGAAVTYTDDPVLKGSRSIKFEVGATSASAYVRWEPPLTSVAAGGMWFEYESTYGGNCSIMSFNNGGTAYARVQITSGDKIRVLSASGSSLYTSTYTMTPGERYYVSARFLGAVSGTFEIKLYDAAGTLLEDVGPTAGDFTGQFNRPQYGCVANQTNANWRPLVADSFEYRTVHMPVPDVSNTGEIAGTLGSLVGDLSGTATGQADLAGTLGTVSADLAGTGAVDGNLTGTLGTVSADFAGTGAVHGDLTGTLGAITGDFEGSSGNTAILAGTLGLVTGDISATGYVTGALAGSLGTATADLAGHSDTDAVLNGSFGSLTGDFTGTSTNVVNEGVLNGSFSKVTSDHDASAEVNGYIGGTTSALVADFSGSVNATATLAGSFGSVQADFTGSGFSAHLDGTLGNVTSHIEGASSTEAQLAGTFSGLTGFFDTDDSNSGSIDATLPALTADAAGTVSQTGEFTGALGAATADVNGSASVSGVVAGSLGSIAGDFSASTVGTSVLYGTFSGLEADMAGSSYASGTLTATLPGLTADMSMTLPDLADHSDLMPFFASRYGFASY